MKLEDEDHWFKRLIPSPMLIAVLLTGFTFVVCLLTLEDKSIQSAFSLFDYWQKGFWELLEFSMQMVLILVLGHMIALSPSVDRLLGKITALAKTAPQGVALIALSAVMAGFINWGLCLILGAVLARKMGQHFQENGIKGNYALMAAAGYSGMVVWHGGLSGSAPLKVAESHHFLIEKIGQVTVDQTIFSSSNLLISLALLLCIPLFFAWLARRFASKEISFPFPPSAKPEAEKSKNKEKGWERWEQIPLPALVFSGLILFTSIYLLITKGIGQTINLNMINFMLFGMALLLHGNFHRFQHAGGLALQGALGIVLQFPIYGGIMGLMKYSGLGIALSGFFVQYASPFTFPMYTFFSAALVNFFIPSGGGQWAIQGPIVVEAAQNLGLSIPQAIMAIAYGDQVSNMLQPFWALPLLGITGLKAKDILPFSSMLFLLATFIFLIGIILSAL